MSLETRTPVLAEARFHPRLKTYWNLSITFSLIASIIGIVAVPFWLIFGNRYLEKRYQNLACLLTERSLVVRHGVVIKTEKTIPLNKIQDISLKEGPVLRYLGLAKLDVETAGHSSTQGQSEAALVGVQDVYDFRDRVLSQAERLDRREGASHQETKDETSADILSDIRKSLLRIEKQLSNE